jgi:xylan 1,4-beta-xylosidase
MRKLINSFLLVLVFLQATSAQVNYTVDYSKTIGKNTGFWKACGYDFLFKIVNEPEGQTFLDRAQKNNTVKYFRTHNTFSNRSTGDKKAGGNICGKVLTIDEKGQYHYDFSIVNKTFKEYVKRGMKPIVEFDFYPDGFNAKSASKTNDELFESHDGPPVSWEKWQELLDKFMQNLIKEFGEDEMKTWYFEVWNEPDGWDRELIPDFYKLYDVFAHTVKSYNNKFKVGGPAAFNLPFLKDFLNHVVLDTNYVTKKIGSPIDFISYHIYGISGGWLEKAPEMSPIVQKFSNDMLLMERLVSKYPSLKNTEFHINEWGLCSNGDSKFVTEYPQLEYRNSEVSGLFLAKLVDCLYAINDNYKFKTSLLLYWGAWFNAATGPIFWGSRDLMTLGCVPKPILTSYEMLALLGDDRLKITGPKTGGPIGLLATKGKNECQLLVYNFNEFESNFNQKTNVQMLVDNLDFSGKQVNITEYWLSKTQHNTYREWERMGKPQAAPDVIEKLKKTAELSPDKQYIQSLNSNKLALNLDLMPHSMCLITITSKN